MKNNNINLPVLVWDDLNENKREKSLQRCLNDQNNIESQVKEIINQVKVNGDSALIEYTQQFDKVNLPQLRLNIDELKSGQTQSQPELKRAITQAAERIRQYAKLCYPEIKIMQSEGITCERQSLPIQRVGLYVPGGQTPLISTLLMLVVTARVAGCEEIVVCTPPKKDGTVDATLLAAAQYCGVKTLYLVGGAQAIAAMAYGTDSIKKVDKIFGPGNRWVTAAKQLVAADVNGASIDMLAGPSELMVIADQSAQAKYIAADLLSQAEHGPDSQVICITNDERLIGSIQVAINQQLNELPRQSIIKKALQNSLLILVKNTGEAISIANRYAPEHLSIQVQSPREWVKKIKNAGTIFIGSYSAETFGDYVTGSNHVLPTQGTARWCSGLSIRDFIKTMTVQTVSEQGLRKYAETAMVLADKEGLQAHRNAVKIRLDQINLNCGVFNENINT